MVRQVQVGGMQQAQRRRPGGAAPPGETAAGAEEGGRDWRAIIQQMVRTIMLFYFVNTVTNTLFNKKGPVQDGSRNPTAGGTPGGRPQGNELVHRSDMAGAVMGHNPSAVASGYQGPLFSMWREHDPMDLYVFLTENEAFDYNKDIDSLLWSEKGLTFDWEASNNREKEVNITLTPNLQNNGSAWAHVIFTRHGALPNHPDPHTRSYRRFQLNMYKKQKKSKNLKNLLGSGTTGVNNGTSPATVAVVDHKREVVASEGSSSQNETTTGDKIVSYWKPTLSLQLVHHHQPFSSSNHVPPSMWSEMDVEQSTGMYYPIIYNNEFWILSEHLIPLNDTIQQVPLKLSYSPIGLFKWQMLLQMDSQFKSQQNSGYSSEGESDLIRRMLLETNPILLAITMVVSCLHMLFDMLAFKNDISFWRKNKSMEGLSLRTIVINTFFQAVVFLYLADHDTSWMVLFSSGTGLLIEIWKIQKAFLSSITWVDPATGRRLLVPKVVLKAVESYSGNKTQQFDEEATSHLMFVVGPLMVGYAAYSLVYERHKSWYSWIITSLTGFVYVFGFVMMTPQLYINYKLKSVAHMPWRTMVYKSLNTFIDDLFAFIIKMPTMHRLSCFRDDIIFLIYLYQRWIYPVDKKRVNEFGQITDENKDTDEAKELLETLPEEEKQNPAVARLTASERSTDPPSTQGVPPNSSSSSDSGAGVGGEEKKVLLTEQLD